VDCILFATKEELVDGYGETTTFEHLRISHIGGFIFKVSYLFNPDLFILFIFLGSIIYFPEKVFYGSVPSTLLGRVFIAFLCEILF
jgi:hypothetical protein